MIIISLFLLRRCLNTKRKSDRFVDKMRPLSLSSSDEKQALGGSMWDPVTRSGEDSRERQLEILAIARMSDSGANGRSTPFSDAGDLERGLS